MELPQKPGYLTDLYSSVDKDTTDFFAIVVMTGPTPVSYVCYAFTILKDNSIQLKGSIKISHNYRGTKRAYPGSLFWSTL